MSYIHGKTGEEKTATVERTKTVSEPASRELTAQSKVIEWKTNQLHNKVQSVDGEIINRGCFQRLFIKNSGWF